MLPLAVAALGCGVLAGLVMRVRREIPATQAAFDRLTRELRPALLEVRTQNERTRAQVTRREQRS
jgi:hypothetical protein